MSDNIGNGGQGKSTDLIDLRRALKDLEREATWIKTAISACERDDLEGVRQALRFASEISLTKDIALQGVRKGWNRGSPKAT